MLSKAETPQQYLDQLAEQQKDPITNLRNVIVKNLPLGFTEILNYGMIGYVVPHSIYPNGYHCNPKKPLPFMALAAQKKTYFNSSPGYIRERNPNRVVKSSVH